MDEAAEALLLAASRPPVGLATLSRLIHLRKTKEDAPEFKILQSFLDPEQIVADDFKRLAEDYVAVVRAELNLSKNCIF